MRIGIRSVCLSKNLEHSLALSKKAGLEGVQVSPTEARVYEASDKDLLAFRQRVKEAGLEIASLSAGPNLVNPALSEKSVSQFQQLLHAAAVLGGLPLTGEVKALPQGLSPEEGWKTCIENVRNVCETAQREGVDFCVEPGASCLVRTTEDLARLIAGVDHPRLRINFDGGNLWSAGSDCVEAARRLGRDVGHVHIKDWSRSAGKETALGEGDVDYEATVRELRKAGYDGWLVIERERTSDPEADTLKAARRLREILSQL